MSGRKYVFGGNRARITLEKQWHSAEIKFPLQTVVADIDVHDSAGRQYSTVEVVLFLLLNQYSGSEIIDCGTGSSK